MRAAFTFALGWLTVSLCWAKTQVSSISLGEDQRWGYISKFGFSPGTGNYSLRIRSQKRLVKSTSLTFHTYLDEDWDSILEMKEPCDRTKKAKKSMSISLPSSGEWSAFSSGSVKNSVRSHVWYFALLDCRLTIPDPSLEHLQIEYEVSMLNEYGNGFSHFSVETRWTLPSNVLSLLCFMTFCGLFAKRCMAETYSVGRLHTVIWALGGVVALQLAAQFLHAVHLWRYSYNGMGIRILEITAEILFIVSQLVQSALLILIAYGYTLIPVDVEPATVLAAFGITALLHVILVLLIKAEDSADKFHDYDGMPGKLLLAFRLSFFALFLWCLKSTLAGAGFRIRSLLVKFGLIGASYFVGPPLLVLVVSVFAPYWRPPILNTLLMVLQIGTAWWLHSLFLSRGEYFKVSELNASSLPGGTRSPRTPRDSPKRD